jgi:hypothetical protein
MIESMIESTIELTIPEIRSYTETIAENPCIAGFKIPVTMSYFNTEFIKTLTGCSSFSQDSTNAHDVYLHADYISRRADYTVAAKNKEPACKYWPDDAFQLKEVNVLARAPGGQVLEFVLLRYDDAAYLLWSHEMSVARSGRGWVSGWI